MYGGSSGLPVPLRNPWSERTMMIVPGASYWNFAIGRNPGTSSSQDGCFSDHQPLLDLVSVGNAGFYDHMHRLGAIAVQQPLGICAADWNAFGNLNDPE